MYQNKEFNLESLKALKKKKIQIELFIHNLQNEIHQLIDENKNIKATIFNHTYVNNQYTNIWAILIVLSFLAFFALKSPLFFIIFIVFCIFIFIYIFNDMKGKNKITSKITYYKDELNNNNQKINHNINEIYQLNITLNELKNKIELLNK